MKFFYTFSILLFAELIFAQSEAQHTFDCQKMGTKFQFIYYHTAKKDTQSIDSQLIEKLNYLNQIFSDYEPTSEISRLSASAGTGKKVKVSEELWRVLKASRKISRKSDGAFDISIGPLSKLWRSMFRKREIFDGVKINNKKKLVNYKKVELYPFSRRVKLKKPEMRLDAGGIAKGFALDELGNVFRKNGITAFLIDGGGDILVGNAPPKTNGWKIHLTTNFSSEMYEEEIVSVNNCAIASSGDTYRFLEANGKRYSHIIDPRTGYGVSHQQIVNVLANSGLHADAIASTLSVLPKTEWANFLKKVKKLRIQVWRMGEE